MINTSDPSADHGRGSFSRLWAQPTADHPTMRIRTVICYLFIFSIILLSILMLATRLLYNRPIEAKDMIGVYKFSNENVIVLLKLKAHGKYLQEIYSKDGRKITHTGKWSF